MTIAPSTSELPASPQAQPIADTDLPRVYRLTDRFAIDAQGRYLRSVRNHIACLIGASFSQMCLSLYDPIAFKLDVVLRYLPAARQGFWVEVWQWLLVMFVILGLATRFQLRLRQPDQPWVKARGLAEQAKRLAWYFMMGLSPEGQPEPDKDEARRRYLEALKPVREKWRQLAPPGADLLPGAPEISEVMRNLRSAPLEKRMAVYREHRLTEQLDWFQRKAAWHIRRAGGFAYGQTITELLALVTALAYATGYAHFEKWNSTMWPLLTVAASILAWTGHRRYRETAATYEQTAENLVPLLQELDEMRMETGDEPRFADWLGRCEEILGRENALWQTRRGG